MVCLWEFDLEKLKKKRELVKARSHCESGAVNEETGEYDLEAAYV